MTSCKIILEFFILLLSKLLIIGIALSNIYILIIDLQNENEPGDLTTLFTSAAVVILNSKLLCDEMFELKSCTVFWIFFYLISAMVNTMAAEWSKTYSRRYIIPITSVHATGSVLSLLKPEPTFYSGILNAYLLVAFVVVAYGAQTMLKPVSREAQTSQPMRDVSLPRYSPRI